MKMLGVRIALILVLLSGLVRINPPGSANRSILETSEPVVTFDLAASPADDPDPRELHVATRASGCAASLPIPDWSGQDGIVASGVDS